LTLVVDASVAIPACLAEAGFDVLPDRDLVAPPLMWSETCSALHEPVWRRELSAADGAAGREALAGCPVRRIEPKALGGEAWRLADEFGWAKTYDAEYVALASLLGCRVVTLDGRLVRGAARLGLVVTPADLT
jgi:predicted nucleic acid-binding protein